MEHRLFDLTSGNMNSKWHINQLIHVRVCENFPNGRSVINLMFSIKRPRRLFQTWLDGSGFYLTLAIYSGLEL